MDREMKTGRLVADSVRDLVGNTPMVRLNRLVPPECAEVLAKLESFNPGGSVKDRIALAMIERAEEEGRLRPGSVVIEPSTGNTGIGLAMVCAARGYRCIIVIPESMSLERIFLLRRFGAEVVLTAAKDDMAGAVKKARELLANTPGAVMPLQFENALNPEVHRRRTAEEILLATEGRLDAFVAGVGTGGTVTGVGEVLKARVPGVRVVAVEPAASPVLSTGKVGYHKIQGIGAGFVPAVLNRAVLDEVRTVIDVDAYEMMKSLGSKEGILAGMSSGAAVCVALQIAAELGPGKRVVVVLPDTGERYLTLQHYFEF